MWVCVQGKYNGKGKGNKRHFKGAWVRVRVRVGMMIS